MVWPTLGSTTAEEQKEHLTTAPDDYLQFRNALNYQLTWHVDPCLCRCRGLMILETFTTLTGDDLPLPSFLEISKEITGDPAYSMYYLSLNDPCVPTGKLSVIANGYKEDDVDHNCNM